LLIDPFEAGLKATNAAVFKTSAPAGLLRPAPKYFPAPGVSEKSSGDKKHAGWSSFRRILR
jgi:hypothetical protein